METRKTTDNKKDGDEIEEASQKEQKKGELESTERTHTAWSAILMMKM